uniref:Uncharacterized protein n=1 Tax=Lepeophtheirus salmonis TaxID=72036 RepID=A0A0K2U9K0_LEPSM
MVSTTVFTCCYIKRMIIIIINYLRVLSRRF